MNSDELEAFYGHCYLSGNKLRPENLEAMGYRFTARFVNIGHRYKLFELLPQRSGQPADVCFLSENVARRGVIIQDPFHEHKTKLLSMNPIKDKVLNAHALFKQKVNPHPYQSQGKQPGGALSEQEGQASALNRGTIEGGGLRAQG